MSKLKYLIKFFAICLCTGIIFFASGYLYLNKELSTVDDKVSSVPYYQEAPDNAGLLFKAGDEGVLLYLDFTSSQLSVIFDEDNIAEIGGILYGYSVDYILQCDYDLLAGIVDILGGIELENEGEVFRYTGVQVKDALSTAKDHKGFIREIILKITEKIEKIGFQNEDFLYIIENSKTNLTVPDCYYWAGYLPDLCSNVQLIN